ncbi:MAG: hypothetical protein A3C22_03070 [Candidatus Levybacteria bacterium RIFCSPHIGHO2_02_FULL_37_10]|nr:MAG: hypothetical protein A3C22_03070 [Candidatus Levybacteria bacterium RIFCSPHIGHO2_02_FULL_37_10]
MKEFNRASGVPGPGEILSELRVALNVQVLEGKITSSWAQEYFNETQRGLNILALANPKAPWETGSTQVRELERKERELRAAAQNAP